MPINPQLISGLMGRNYVAQPDEDNWLTMQAKRNAVKGQEELRRAQVSNYESEIANRNADNARAEATRVEGVITAAANKKKQLDDAAKLEKEKAEKLEKERHGSVFSSLYMNPTQATLDAHLANGDINQDEYDQFNTIPSEKWKPTAAAGVTHNLGEAALRTIDKEQSALAKDTADIAENQAKADERKQELDAFKAQWEAKNPGKAATPADFITWKRTPVAKEDRPNTPTELAIIAADPKQPKEARDAAEGALKRLTEQTKAGRSVVTIQNHAPGLGNPTANQNLRGEDFLKSLPPATASAVRAIATGNDVMPAANARSQAAQDIRNAVYQFDPNFTVQRAQVRKAFTTGPDAKNIGALNTAIVHLGRLDEAADALENGSFGPGNDAYNYLRDKFGSDKVTNFTLLKDAVAGEMAAALKGNATDIEISKMGQSIRSSNSPEQMKGIVSEGMAILGDKANTYNERYHALMPDDPWTPVLPSARAAMTKRGVGSPPKTVRMMSPSGQTKEVPADQVSHFEKLGAKRAK